MSRRGAVIAGVALAVVSGLTVPATAANATAETVPATTIGPAAVPPVQPANPVDPGIPGRFGTFEGEYDLPEVSIPELAKPVEMRALVIAPKGVRTKRPMVVFLHGRQDACYTPGEDEYVAGWPCPHGSLPVPSHRGFRSMQQLLASQGYLTVSIAANGVNAQDGLDDFGAQARSSLIRLHLGKWADWAGAGANQTPAVVRQAPPADLSRVMVIGHSRGGEGANRAVMDSLAPPPPSVDGYRGKVRWTIRGLVGIGPTNGGQNPVPDVPSMIMLGGCGGDATLTGQIYVDATRGVSSGRALHSALYVIGANHNFYNSEWTPGQSAAPSDDDWWDADDPVCGPGRPTRLTAGQQQQVGATYVAAAARVFLEDDDAVLPLIDGSGVSVPSAGPARVLSHAIGAARTPVIIPDPAVLRVDGARLCEQVNDNDESKACLPCRAEDGFGSPHFTGFNYMNVEPGRWAVRIDPGKLAVLTPEHAAEVGGELAMRLIVPPNTTGNRFGIAVIDRSGRRADLGEVHVDGLPGTTNTFSHWAREVRVPLRDVSSIAKLEIHPRGSATGWLLDAWGRRPGTPDPQTRGLPRIDVGSARVKEGDSGTTTIDLPLTVTGSGAGQVRVFINNMSSTVLTVKPGDRRLTVPFSVPANTRFGDDTLVLLHAKAVRGLVVGNYFATSVIENDDPAPTVVVDPASEVTEGATMRWQIKLSEPADAYACLEGTVVAPDGAPELSTTDVDPHWLTDQDITPEPSRPLSKAGAYASTCVEPGQLTGDLDIPTVTDDVTEAPEDIRVEAKIHLGSRTFTQTLTGHVTDPHPSAGTD
ncbi:hypothetical protein AB0M54_39955 [Actinoplanes sp. NPDC051470]|uniref:alpha/beta hydrolase family protein n=1 Tax=Actinoplanes sp. NPDC051470 TaxID=3157224 RepID=UPI00343914C4